MIVLFLKLTFHSCLRQALTPSYGVYFSQQVWFVCVCTKVSDFNDHKLHLTGKLLQQGYNYHIISFSGLLQNFTTVTNISYKNMYVNVEFWYDKGYHILPSMEKLY